ncbi:MAG: DUF4278 domain-containing protein [Cyanobacteria bacterium Co-bin13]|nr:DUF4278 domain-containing protein [Cyanobacteria bacterium Co-bin13]
MNLSYRGVTYNPSAPSVETRLSEETSTFLGVRYSRKQPQVAERSQFPEELTFLGRRYTR